MAPRPGSAGAAGSGRVCPSWEGKEIFLSNTDLRSFCILKCGINSCWIRDTKFFLLVLEVFSWNGLKITVRRRSQLLTGCGKQRAERDFWVLWKTVPKQLVAAGGSEPRRGRQRQAGQHCAGFRWHLPVLLVPALCPVDRASETRGGAVSSGPAGGCWAVRCGGRRLEHTLQTRPSPSLTEQPGPDPREGVSDCVVRYFAFRTAS